jgi:hypothetical protein
VPSRVWSFIESQMDTKLVAFLRKGSPKSLYGASHYISGETEVYFSFDKYSNVHLRHDWALHQKSFLHQSQLATQSTIEMPAPSVAARKNNPLGNAPSLGRWHHASG